MAKIVMDWKPERRIEVPSGFYFFRYFQAIVEIVEYKINIIKQNLKRRLQ